jgi:hypothetical protein
VKPARWAALFGATGLLACATSGHHAVESTNGAAEAGGGGADVDVVVVGGGGDLGSQDAGSGPEIDVDSASPPPIRDAQTDYSASCGTCEAGSMCASGYRGTYCVHSCPGQRCPPSGPQVPYCDSYGGVHCLSQ